MNYLIIDIETIPDDTVEKPILDELSIKFGNTKDPDKKQIIIEKAKDEFATGLTKKMSIDSNFARILSIGGILVNEKYEEIKRFCYYGDDSDSEIISQFIDFINTEDIDIIVGWNSKKFDIPMIWKRGILTGNKVWSIDIKDKMISKYGNYSIDLMQTWNGFDSYGKLSDCAKRLNIKCKTGLDGSMIYQAFKDGRKKDIMDYNMEDCEVTLAILKRVYL